MRIPGAAASPATGVPFTAVFSAAAILAGGCATTQPAGAPALATMDSAHAPVVTMSLRVGSLDLSGRSTRVELSEVEALARIVERENIDVLAVQGVTRYPTLATRVDPVEAFYKATGMTYVIGETISSTGRQTLNAVFSAYPILSSENKHFSGISGTNFEASVRAIVDAGPSDIVIVSTRLPEPLSSADAEICTASLDAILDEYEGKPVGVFGNLPAPARRSGYVTAPVEGASPFWYTGLEDFTADPAGSASVQTPLGLVRTVTFKFLAPGP